MQTIVAFVVGLTFGLGLILAGMTDPGKVLGFLDLAGDWDPSLAFVMGGAIGVAFFAFMAARRRHLALLGCDIRLPGNEGVDRRLVTGSLVFGLGWGLAGFCPGPALVAAGAGHWQAWLFLASMVAGMALHDLRAPQPAPEDPVLE